MIDVVSLVVKTEQIKIMATSFATHLLVIYRWSWRILQRRLPFFRGPRQEGIQMIGYSVYKEHERKPPHSITR